MSYFKYLVILISFFLHFHIKSNDIISFDNLYLSKNDLKIFKVSLKEGDKTKWKRSLFGDQHMHGPEGVRFYTKLKTITSRWPSGIRSNPEFVMPTMK